MNELSGYQPSPRCGRATQAYRQNRGNDLRTIAGAAVILFGFLVVFSIVAPPSTTFNLGFPD
jgi:hypothetical protein